MTAEKNPDKKINEIDTKVTELNTAIDQATLDMNSNIDQSISYLNSHYWERLVHIEKCIEHINTNHKTSPSDNK